MVNLQKHPNGPPNDLKVTFKGGALVTSGVTNPGLPTLLRSSIPCFLFLFVYGINGRVRILPRATDVHCVTLHNISTLESVVFPAAPHRVVASFHTLPLDALSALPYLLHYMIPLLYPAYLYATGRFERAPCFLWLLGWSMWAHYLIWFLLPTAPPWVQDNIDLFRRFNNSPPPIELQHREGCAFARLDHWAGLPFFYSIFSGNPVPFASFPSGHVAWPMCILMTLPTARERRWFGFYIAWVAWATMYSCHHYLTDIIAAILLVTMLDRIMTWLNHQQQQRRYKNAMDNCLLSVIAR